MKREMLRVDLSAAEPGGYALVRPVLTWDAFRRASQAPDDWTLFMDAELRSVVVEWNITDDDGAPLPLPRDLTDEQIGQLDYRIPAGLIGALREIMERMQPDPNAKGASSTS